MDNYYKILGVPEFSSLDTIKTAYRKLSMKYHPDNFMNTSEEEKASNLKKQQELNQAWNILSTEEKKNKYDSSLKQSMGYYDANPFEKFQDIFNNQSKKNKSDFDTDKSQSYDNQESNTFYSQQFKDMMQDMFQFGTANHPREILRQKYSNLKDLISKREKAIRLKSLEDIKPMQEELNQLNQVIFDLNEKHLNLESQLSNKARELTNLRNRKMYQLMPKRFASAEAVLMEAYQQLQLEDDKLLIQLEETKSKFKALQHKMFNYPDECVKNDAELIDLHLQLDAIEQQLMNYSSRRMK